MQQNNVITRVDVAAFVERGCVASLRQIVLCDGAREWTGQQALERTRSLAAYLQETGGLEQPVLIALGDRAETIEAYWAAVRAGQLAVPLACEPGGNSLAEARELTGAKTALVSAERFSEARMLPGLGGLVLGAAGNLPPAWRDYEAVASAAANPADVQRGDDDACALTFAPSAGGARPTVAVRTHRAVALTATLGSVCLGASSHRLVVCLPLHGRALETVAVGAPMLGVPMRIVAPGDSAALADVLISRRGDWMLANLATAAAVAPKITGRINPSQSVVSVWSLFVSPDQLPDAVEQADAAFKGISDVAPQFVAGTDLAGHVLGGYRHAAANGHPWPTVDLAVRQPDGRLIHEGVAEGRLAIRSPQASMRAYQKSAAFIRDDGWLDIGALGQLGEHGFVSKRATA
ncbi:MAG TPA: AMP-binding protein [Candidatus Binataceae bacterium]|nr:AMP-binding protein [Candidatus Binataceae bacterium]